VVATQVPPARRAEVQGQWTPDQTLAFLGQAHDPGLLLSSLRQAWVELEKLQGPDSKLWQWGKLHTITFRHPLDQFPQAQSWDLGPLSRPGDEYAVNSTGGPEFTQAAGASYREILDPGDWNRSIAVNTPGQSGQPGSAHYSDLLPLWSEGRYFPLLYSREAVENAAESKLTLNPQ